MASREQIFEALSRWNPWGPAPFETGVERDARDSLRIWLERPEIVAICGMRRVGKSTLMRQLARSLMDSGTRARDILFVNFEEPVFLDRSLDTATLDRTLEAYLDLIRPSAGPHLFLDEIQNVSGWGNWVRSFVETGRGRCTVSGSSSKLLEPEIATVLTGRNFTCNLWPLSFGELLRFRRIEIGDRAALIARGAEIRRELADFLHWGGLPAVVLASDDRIKAGLLEQYFRDILFRDVVARHEVRDVRALEQVAHHYLVNTANLTTFNRVKNAYGLAMDQVRSYTSHLEEAFLVRAVPRLAHKAATVARAPRKMYAVDVGLRNAVAFRFSQDLGRLAETVVHGALCSSAHNPRIYYWSGRRECDFVVWHGDRAIEAVQVCYDPDDQLPDREIEGLVEALEAVGLSEGTLVTHATAFDREVGGRRIRAIPLWQWLLREPIGAG